MSKTVFFILIVALIALNFACAAPEKTNTNTNTSANVRTIDEANLPEGFSNKPITPSGDSTPGIPDPSNINVKPNPNGTPTPGIQDPAKATPFPKGAKTPGIPDEKTLREMMNNSRGNVNSSSVTTDSDKTPQPKTNRKP